MWASEGTDDSDETVVGVANSLRNYFVAQNFKPESVVVNRQLAENTIEVFRASDLQNRTVLVLLSGAGAAARKDAKTPRPPPLTPSSCHISQTPHTPTSSRSARASFERPHSGVASRLSTAKLSSSTSLSLNLREPASKTTRSR